MIVNYIHNSKIIYTLYLTDIYDSEMIYMYTIVN